MGDYTDQIGGDVDFIRGFEGRQLCVSIHVPARLSGRAQGEGPEGGGPEGVAGVSGPSRSRGTRRGGEGREGGEGESVAALGSEAAAPEGQRGASAENSGDQQAQLYSSLRSRSASRSSVSSSSSGTGPALWPEITPFWMRPSETPTIGTPRLTEDPTPLEQDVTIIYSHGNAETLVDVDSSMFAFANAFQCRVVAFDYEGYGMSQGKPSERAINRDAIAVWRYVRGRFPRTRIIVWGRSIGTVCACYLAKYLSGISPGRDEKTDPPPPPLGGLIGLILQSPLASAFNVLRLFKRGIPLDCFRTYQRIRGVRCPVLIVHGVADNIVPVWNTYRILLSVALRERRRQPPDWGDMELPQSFRDIEAFEGEPSSPSTPGSGQRSQGGGLAQHPQRRRRTFEGRLGNVHYCLIRKASHNDLEALYYRDLAFAVRGFLYQVVPGYRHSGRRLPHYWKAYSCWLAGRNCLPRFAGVAAGKGERVTRVDGAGKAGGAEGAEGVERAERAEGAKSAKRGN